MADLKQVVNVLNLASQSLQGLREKYDGALDLLDNKNTQITGALDRAKSDALQEIQTKKNEYIREIVARANEYIDNKVTKTGNETIAGVKTFSVPPVSATNPTANNQVANKSYVDTVGNSKVALSAN
ncbi:hypothetical protein [Campylobacter coli]|uniref:hypothetical protein n=1 Tax=Campylobacter coli TaxID=195 RepID=UPI0004B13D61|nr:hypothetical protein [Campylobacter coli]